MLLIDRRGRILVVVLEGEWSEFRTLEGVFEKSSGTRWCFEVQWKEALRVGLGGK